MQVRLQRCSQYLIYWYIYIYTTLLYSLQKKLGTAAGPGNGRLSVGRLLHIVVVENSLRVKQIDVLFVRVYVPTVSTDYT